MLLIKLISSCEIALSLMLQNAFEDKSALVQVMAWGHLVIVWTNIDQDLCCHMASLGHNMWTPKKSCPIGNPTTEFMLPLWKNNPVKPLMKDAH